MLDTKLSETGTILMHGGHIYIAGFSADDCSCREVAAHAMLWAIAECQRELAELINGPAGAGKSVIDLPPEVEHALGTPSPFDDFDDDIA